jgi:hypothetical protein
MGRRSHWSAAHTGDILAQRQRYDAAQLASAPDPEHAAATTATGHPSKTA